MGSWRIMLMGKSKIKLNGGWQYMKYELIGGYVNLIEIWLTIW